MLEIIKNFKQKVAVLSNQFIRVLFIEDNKEIKQAKEILKGDENISVVELHYFKTPRIKEQAAEIWYQKRKDKGVSLDDAKSLIEDDLNFALALVYLKYIDVFIVGSNLTSKKCFSSILKLLKKENDNFVSSTMIMSNDDDLILMSDCALNLELNQEEVLKTAEHSMKIAKEYLDLKNNYQAYINYQTQDVLKNINDKTNIIGPIQYDAVVDIKARNKKQPSFHSHKINHFIFDNLKTANTVFKIYQKTLNYTTIGSYISNIDFKVSVISRSSSVDEIVATTYLLVLSYLIDDNNKSKTKE